MPSFSDGAELRCGKKPRLKFSVFFLQRALTPSDNRGEAAVGRAETMKNVANGAALAAFVLGVAGFYLYSARLAVRLGGGPLVAVLMVTQDLTAGQTLGEEHLGQANVPSSYLDARRILASEKKKVLGVAVESALHAGDGLVWSDLRDGKAHQSLAELVAPGHRAFSLPAKANPLGDLLHAGDVVDVLLEHGARSEVLLERVLVLTVGETLATVETDQKAPKSRRNSGVTLSVSQAQAADLFGAMSKGDLLLVLRNPDDMSRRTPVSAPVASREPVAQKQEIEHVR